MFKNFFANFGKKNDGFYAVAEEDNAAPKAEAQAPAKSEPAAVAASATPEPAAKVDVKAAAKAEKAAAKAAAKAEKKSGQKAETPTVTATPAPVAAAVSEAPITNFATDYLIKPSSISGRRQPGANMKGFLELARQVEKPKGFKAAASERK